MDASQYLLELASTLKIDSSKQERIDKSIAFLQKSLWGDFQSRLSKTEIFGSYDRETIILQDENADVDIMVIFKQKEVKPDTYLNQLKQFCKEHYPTSKIYQEYPTIVIDMYHIRFQIVPAYSISPTIRKIPSPKRKEFVWINTSPTEFKQILESKDQNSKGLVKPLIRIFKYWNGLNSRPFNSFEIEKLILSKSKFDSIQVGNFFAIGTMLLKIAATNEQKRACKLLHEKQKRLKILEENKMTEHIQKEFSTFLPIP